MKTGTFKSGTEAPNTLTSYAIMTAKSVPATRWPTEMNGMSVRAIDWVSSFSVSGYSEVSGYVLARAARADPLVW